ncbi:MAG: translocation/assembly module TamB [Proteobacteria bacterium]|nr:translocation/assembly module TamB [Pseudomonadota bacterium]
MTRRQGALRRTARLGALGLGCVLLVSVLLLLAALGYARSSSGRARLRSLLVELVRQRLPGFQLGALGGDYLGSLVLQDVTVNDRLGGAAIQIGAVRLRYDLGGLLRRRLRIEQLVVERPCVLLRAFQQGGSNLAQLALPPSAATGAKVPKSTELSRWTVELSELQVTDGSFVDQRAAKGASLRGLSGRAAARLDRGAVELTLHQLRAVLRLAGQEQLTIALQGAARLSSWRRVDARLRLRIAGLPAGPTQMQVVLAGPLQHLQLHAHAELGRAGALRLQGWLEPLSAQLRYQFGLSLDHFRPAALVAALPETRLELRLEGRGQGLPLQPASELAVHLELAAGEVAGLTLQRSTLIGRLAASRWAIDRLDLRARGVRLQASAKGTLDQLEATLSVAVPELARVRLIQLQSLKLAGPLQLAATLSGRFGDALSLRLNGSSQGLRVAGARLGRLEFAGALRGLPGNPRGRLTVTALAARSASPPARVDYLRVTLKGGRREGEAAFVARGLLGGAAQGRASWRDHGPQRARLEATLQALRPAGLPRLSGRIVAVAEGRSLRAHARLQLTDTQTRLALEANLPLTYAPGALLPVFAAQRPASVELTVAGFALESLPRLGLGAAGLGGTLALSARLAGELSSPRLSADLELKDARLAGLKGVNVHAVLALDDRLRLRADATQGASRLLQLEGRLALTAAEALGVGADPLGRLGRAPLQLRIESGSVRLEQLTMLLPSFAPLASGRLRGRAHLGLRAGGQLFDPHVELELLLDAARLDRQRLGDLRLRAQLGSAEPAASTRATLRFARDGQVLLRGRAALKRGVEELLRFPKRIGEAALTGTLELPQTPLRGLAQQDGWLSQLEGGVLTGRASVAGTVAQPSFTAALRLHDLRVAGGPVGTLELRAEGARRGVSGQLTLRQPHGGSLASRGQVALTPPEPTIDTTLRGTNLDLGFLAAFLTEVQRTEGRLTIEGSARGPLTRPRVRARVQLSDGRLRARGLPELKGIALRASLDPQRARLERLVIHSGAGRLVATGSARSAAFLPRDFELSAKAQRFRLGVAPIADAVFDGDLQVSGRLQDMTLVSQVTVDKGVLTLPKLSSPRRLHPTSTLADVVFVDADARAARVRRQRRKALGEVTQRALDLTTRADSLMVRGEDLDVELTVALRVKAGPGAAPRIVGSAGIRRGQVTVLGNAYQVEHAVARFSGREPIDPSLDVRLRREFAEGTVSIVLRGTLAQHELILSSEPPSYDQSQLLSLILTGRLDPRAGESGGDKALALASAVAQAVFGLLAKQVAGKVGIDVTRVGVSQTQDEKKSEARLRAEAEIGKYLTRRLYVAYRRVFGAAETENANEALGEYRISARWLLMALFGDRGVGNLDLAWTYRY